MLIDILILIAIGISVIIAFLRGFIREVLTIFGVVGGILSAYFFGPVLAPKMRLWTGINEEDPEKLFGILPFPLLADILSYAAIFIIVVVLLSLLSHVLAETAKTIGLGAVDRTLGVIFGFVRAVLIVSLLYLPFYSSMGEETKDRFFDGSKTHFYLERTTGWIAGFFFDNGLDNDANNAEKGFDNLTRGAREKLESMNLLSPEQLDQLGDQIDLENVDLDQVKEQFDNNREGYTEDFRNQMDKLFEGIEQQDDRAFNE